MNNHIYDTIFEYVTVNCNLARRIHRYCDSQRFMYFCASIANDAEAIKKTRNLIVEYNVDGLKALVDSTLKDYRFWTLEDLRKEASKLGVYRYKALEKSDLIRAIEEAGGHNAS